MRILIAALLLAGCAQPPPKPEKPVLMVPGLPGYDRPIVPYKDPTVLLKADPLTGEEVIEHVLVPQVPNAKPLVCFDLPSHHSWQCVYVGDDDGANLITVIPTQEDDL